MKIGIFVYSEAGHTLSVARLLAEKLTEMGHEPAVEDLLGVRIESQGAGRVQPSLADLKRPAVSGCDAYVFASPVQAFSLPPAMAAWLGALPSLGGARAACFVTKALPWHWTGGNQAVGEILKTLEASGASVAATGIVNWSGAGRESGIRKVVTKIASAFPV